MANEKRLIDAMKLVTKIAKKARFGRIEYDDVLAVIADAPTVDAVEVVHGRWIRGEYEGEYTCSVCGMEYCEADPSEKPYNYCPKCGSKNE